MRHDLVFEFFLRPGSGGFGRFGLQPDYSGSAFALEVGMKAADDRFGRKLRTTEARLEALLHLHWDAPPAGVVSWISSIQKHGHALGRLVGMHVEDVPLVSEQRDIDAWIAYFEGPYYERPAVAAAPRRSRRH